MMVGYLLPTQAEGYTLWFPGTPNERLAWGELKCLGDEVIVLSPTENIEVDSCLLHDNIFRPTIRGTGWIYKFFWLGRLMLWGIIWILGMDNPIEDMLGGIYLLLGLPLFVRATNDTLRTHIKSVQARFESLFYSPSIQIVKSPRLLKLETLMKEDSSKALLHLDELGLGHLREFYKRVAWQERWTLMPPTGAGVIKSGE
jgi:hypothetical protein